MAGDSHNQLHASAIAQGWIEQHIQNILCDEMILHCILFLLYELLFLFVFMVLHFMFSRILFLGETSSLTSVLVRNDYQVFLDSFF